ncbi:hypothetical protein BDP81DRAFT_104258 [Colletotrichum phormii]|uniref:Uncharacterized protein n=1 Tax=Colletotrichum phormii TaxID=359342 RepID=A0AAI9ZK32_9PEZI|nr:uncharacterized protein BDP81DRAFT_104258 [Colletotrichum phormii]KAK1625000.1 hypothetical protein BDP81DRAFT_104258 [Colletotrichum phormii]
MTQITRHITAYSSGGRRRFIRPLRHMSAALTSLHPPNPVQGPYRLPDHPVFVLLYSTNLPFKHIPCCHLNASILHGGVLNFVLDRRPFLSLPRPRPPVYLYTWRRRSKEGSSSHQPTIRGTFPMDLSRKRIPRVALRTKCLGTLVPMSEADGFPLTCRKRAMVPSREGMVVSKI